MLGKIIVHGDKDVPLFDPNLANLVAQVSTQVYPTLLLVINICLFGVFTYNARLPLKNHFFKIKNYRRGVGG